MEEGARRAEMPAWLSSVAAELRGKIGDEFRAEAEAEERAVAALRVRRRRLTDVAVELLHGGAEVSASVEDTTVTGRLTHVASDLATLSVNGASLHLKLGSPIVLSRPRGARAGRGRPRDPMGCDSFLAQLRALSLSAANVRLGVVGAASGVRGCIAAVAVDHLVFRTRDTERFVPLETVWGVWE